MKVKKAGKVLLGADLTNEEQHALNMEIQKSIKEYDRNNTDEIDAVILWNLHLIFGFGEKRLMEFYNNFSKDLHAMCERYELTDREDELVLMKLWTDCFLSVISLTVDLTAIYSLNGSPSPGFTLFAVIMNK